MKFEVPNPFPILSGKLVGFGIEITYARSEKPGDALKIISLSLETPIGGAVFVWEF